MQRTNTLDSPCRDIQSGFLVKGFYAVFLFFTCIGLHAQERYEYTHQQMGTQIRLVFYTSNQGKADTIAFRAFDRIDELNKELSDYLVTSELNSLTKQYEKEVVVSSDLFRILKKSVEISKITKGAFDISVGPLIELWRKTRKTRILPSEAKLIEAKQRVGYSNIAFHNKNVIQLNAKEMKLDLGGIGKGFTADEVIKVLESNGVRSALVDMGGDIRVSNPPPNREYWILAFSYYNEEDVEVVKRIRLKNGAVATSGDLYQFVEIDGIRYSHIINPLTGLALNNSIQVTTIARNATEADAFASAFSVMGIAKTTEFIKTKSNIEVFIVQKSKNTFKQWNNSTFPGQNN